MKHQIVRMFGDIAAAELARAELFAAGFARNAVELMIEGDEAGPGQGNFTVGDSPAVTGGSDYSRTFAHHAAAQQGHYMILVGAAHAGLIEEAAIIMARHGAVEADAAKRHPAAPSNA